MNEGYAEPTDNLTVLGSLDGASLGVSITPSSATSFSIPSNT